MAQPPWQLPMSAGIGAVRVSLRDDLNEPGLGIANIRAAFALAPGAGEEDDEVDRVPRLQRHSDLRVLLEPADSRPVPGSGVHDHKRPLHVVDGSPFGGMIRTNA